MSSSKLLVTSLEVLHLQLDVLHTVAVHDKFVPKALSAPPPTLHYPSHGGGEVLCRLGAVVLGVWWDLG